MSIIALTTDFGTRDYYVAALKGVILGIAPQASIVDVTHDIASQNVQQGAFILWQSLPWFPAGTIHVVVVDPGVGTTRRLLAARCREQIIVAPDNGLLTFVLDDWPADEMRAITAAHLMRERPSRTFHGRDLFAPIAAQLANGVPLSEVGPAANAWERLPARLRAEPKAGGLVGAVIHVDHFGNLVSNIRRTQFAEAGLDAATAEVRMNGNSIGAVHHTFADVPVGGVLAYFGGNDLLEIAVNGGSAGERFGRWQQLRIEVS